MRNHNMHPKNYNRGLSLLITLVIMSVLMGISTSLLNVTLKQYLLSGIARDSEMSFQAAAAGTECAVYHDIQNQQFDVKSDGSGKTRTSISCMNSAPISDEMPGDVYSGDEQRFKFDWGNPGVCTEISVFKFSENAANDVGNDGPNMIDALGSSVLCPEDGTCTVIQSRGYNVPCANIGAARTIERELIQRY